MSKENVTLYQTEDCVFSGLVRRKLDALGLNYEIQTATEGRAEVEAISNQKGVPVLVHGNRVFSDSKLIISYLDDEFGDGKETPLSGRNYGLACEVEGTLEEVREKTIAAMKEQGFGLLTEIDVKATLKKKIDADVVPNSILGFCNPGFAHEGMQAEPDLGLLLPCNVVVREVRAGVMQVSAVNPVRLFAVVGRADMIDMAMEVKNLLQAGIDKLKG